MTLPNRKRYLLQFILLLIPHSSIQEPQQQHGSLVDRSQLSYEGVQRTQRTADESGDKDVHKQRFVLVLGIEGAGHHLIRGMIDHIPSLTVLYYNIRMLHALETIL